jgi:hypothetical protein
MQVEGEQRSPTTCMFAIGVDPRWSVSERIWLPSSDAVTGQMSGRFGS